MTNRRTLVVLLAALASGSAVPLACAESDSSSVPKEDAASDAPGDSTIPDAAVDSEVDAQPPKCSASKICVTAVPIDLRINLTSVWGSSSQDVWAVGTGGTIVHYAGSKWEKANLAERDASSVLTLRSVWVGREDDVWVLDGTSIRHSTGWRGPSETEWSFLGNPVGPGPIPTSVRGAGDSVWIAYWANPASNGPPGGPPTADRTLRKLDPWRDGGPGTPRDFGPVPGPTLTALAAVSPREVWTAGDAVFRASLGTADDAEWQIDEYDSRTTRLLHGVWGDRDGVWLVGEGGVLRHRPANGPSSKTFDVVPSPVVTDLYGVFGFGAGDVWAVGEESTILHWDGKSWSRVSTPFDGANAKDKPRLLAVWGSNPRDVWITGNGTMLHFSENAP